jgi:hypothetical protein
LEVGLSINYLYFLKQNTMTQEKLTQAVENFGREVVAEVRTIVEFADADGAYTTFEDSGMFEHAECVEFLYFED